MSEETIFINQHCINKSQNVFNIVLFLKLNLYDKNHNLLYNYIINNIDDFGSKNHYFRIIENNKITNPELISNNIYLNNFNKITKYLLDVQNNQINMRTNKQLADIDLSIPVKDLIFMLF